MCVRRKQIFSLSLFVFHSPPLVLPLEKGKRKRGEERRRKEKSERSELKFGKRIRFQPGSVYLALSFYLLPLLFAHLALPPTSRGEQGGKEGHGGARARAAASSKSV